MDRRSYLGAAAGVTATALAGCSGTRQDAAHAPAAVLDMDAHSDAALAAEVLPFIRPNGGEAALMGRVVDGDGEATTRRTRPPLHEHDRVVYDGEIYGLSRRVTERTPATGYSIHLAYPDGEVPGDERVAASALPEVDREKLAAYAMNSATIGTITWVVYTDEQRAASALVPEPENRYISWGEGDVGEWIIEDVRETALHTYRYTADHYRSAASYGRRLRERFAFPLEDLPGRQEEILTAATGEGRYTVPAGGSPPDAYRALVDRIESHDPARPLDGREDGSAYLVQHGGETYWTTFATW